MGHIGRLVEGTEASLVANYETNEVWANIAFRTGHGFNGTTSVNGLPETTMPGSIWRATSGNPGM